MKRIFHDKYLRVVFGLSFLVLILIGCLAYAKLGDKTGPLILHFDVYKGIDFLGGKTEVFGGVLLSALAMVFINMLLAETFYNRERFLAYLFGFASLNFAILILIAVSVIININ